MSYEFTYEPLNPTVPNVVTGNNQVDVPSKNPNTLSNPDLSQLGLKEWDQVVPFTCTADVIQNALIPFTAQEQSAWNAAQAAQQQQQKLASAKQIIAGSDAQALIFRALALCIVNGELLPPATRDTVIQAVLNTINSGKAT